VLERAEQIIEAFLVLTDLSADSPFWRIDKERRAVAPATSEEKALRTTFRTQWPNLELPSQYGQNESLAIGECAIRLRHGVTQLAIDRRGVT
jgi:hypothetical protein